MGIIYLEAIQEKRMFCFKRIVSSFIIFSFAIGLTLPVYSQEKPSIAEEALSAPTVQFENRTNRRATPAARAHERGLGLQLADNAINDKTTAVGDIKIFRVFNSDKEKFGADIIELGPKTNFGHILAVQRIVSGYLEKAFEFKPEHADTVSLFIIYYNAELRNRADLLDKSYSEAVISKLDRKKVGIDRSYKNWPSKTQLLIPLKKNVVRPDKADIDREEIKKETEDNKDVKKDEKKELEKVDQERKKDDEKKLDEKDTDLTKKQDQVDQKKEDLTKKQDEIKKDLVDTGKKLEELRKDPVQNAVEIKKEEQKQQDLEKKQQEVKKQQDEVKKEEQKVTQEKKEVQEQKTDNTSRQEQKKEDTSNKTQETTTDQKKDETKKDADATKADETIAALEKEKEDLKKELEKKEEVSENVSLDKILFMRVQSIDKGHYSNELWYVDTAKDDALFRSPFTKICSREFVVVPAQGIMVAGYSGETHDQTDHFLVMLDETKLEFKKQSNESVFWNTPMIQRDNKIYAIESFDGTYRLSRFNPDLTLDARSSDGMSPYSEITFFKDKIYVTGQDKEGKPTTIQVFNRADLKLLKTIVPPK